MKSNMKKIIVLLLFIVVLGTLGFIFYPKKNIQDVLKTKEYAYLPVEAKNYIEKVYEDSGEIILTEKNKKESVPYLNPDYVDYLTLSDSEKEEIEEVPDVYQIDYVKEEISGDTPSRFDLRNVNGKNFVTDSKDQGSLDLCWSFTSMEQAESLLLQKANTSAGNSNIILSPRQLDYATSQNGIVDFNNDYGVRPLGQGGNYFMASVALSQGIGFVKESVFPMTYTYEQRNLTEVLNYSRSQYELEQSIMVPTLSNPTTAQLNSYISTVKQYVMNYGGAYVATQSPTKSCGSINSDGTVILRVDNSCYQNNNHAMQIIGWDDSYSYSYCAMGSYHSNNTSSCSGTLVSGTGAWILRNSWGSDTPYVYFAYDSLNYDVRLSAVLSSMADRTWDNNYHVLFDQYYILTSSSSSQYYQKKSDGDEKIEKIKIYTYGEGGKYTISITSSKESYRKIKTVSIPTAGLYTIDFHNDNVVITDSGFNVEVLATTGNAAYFVKDSISVFTSNVDKTPSIETEDIQVEANGSRTFHLVSYTKNIPSGSNLTYTLKSAGGTDYTSSMTVTNKTVALNMVNATITLNNLLPVGIYKLTTTYGSYSNTSQIVLQNPVFSSGNGSVSNPYVIKTEGELRLMAEKPDAHYLLNNDITLTSDWIPIGTNDEPFTGSFNGGGHQIINMVVPRGYDTSGFFGTVVANNQTSFKNVIFVNPQVEGNGDAGALIGTIRAVGDLYNPPTYSININNISIVGGHVYSYFANAGSLIGSITTPVNQNLGHHTYTINKIFNSSNVGGVQSSGIIGYIIGSPDSEYAPNINLTNIENVGDMYYDAIRTSATTFFTGSHGTVIGYVLNAVNIDLKYYVITSYYRNYVYDEDGLFGTLSSYTTVTKNYGYSILDSNVTIATMKNSYSYSSWSNFSTNWEMNTIDNIKRIPMLKNVPVSYTKFDTITLSVGDNVLLSSFMDMDYDAMKKLTVGTPSNTSVIHVTAVTDSRNGLATDARISAVAAGNSNMTVINKYDGFETTINIRVIGEETAEVTFYKNRGSSSTSTQTGTIGSSITLNPNPFTVTGYKFREWNTKSDGSGDSYANQATFTLTKNTSLYAQWDPIQYNVRYHSNGGSGSMNDSVANYDQTIYLRRNTLTREGYTFTGWNTKSDGTGTTYTDEQAVSNLTTVDGYVVILYAQWRKESTGDESYEIEGYTVHDGYIDDISETTSLSSFKSHFILDGYTVEVNLGNKNYIYTGSKTILYKNGVKEVEFTNIVRGDPSGDGVINSADLLKIVKHLTGSSMMNATQRLAADASFDNNINSADLLKIVKYLKGTGTIKR